MEAFVISKGFPAEEKYSLIDQIRRSSRSVCTNLREAWTGAAAGASIALFSVLKIAELNLAKSTNL